MIRIMFALAVALLVSPVGAQTQGVRLDFHVPSAVTLESTDVYIDLIRGFERRHPNININLLPEDSYDKVLNKVIKRASQNVPREFLLPKYLSY